MNRPNIAISGLTAAGKTTHAKLLATALRYNYVSASTKLLEALGVGPGNNDVWVGDGLAAIDRQRDGDNVDRAVDQAMIEHAAASEGTVYDSWALPFIFTGPAPMIRVYLQSDVSSRALKCQVSQLPGVNASYADCERLVMQKDDTTAQRLNRMYGINVHAPPDFFLTVDNSRLISTATIEAARAGITSFHPHILQVVRNSMTSPSAHKLPPDALHLAGCIVFNIHGDLLLIHRNRDGLTQWEIPGGKVHPGEPAVDAATREFFEEVGMVVRPEKVLGSRAFSERGAQYLYTWVLGASQDEPTLRERHLFDGLRYFSRENLGQLLAAGELSPNAANFVRALAAGELDLPPMKEPPCS